MASKKDFENIKTGRVYSALEQSTSRQGQQGTASPEEAHERAEALRTQGRKGAKAIRINMAFTPTNHKFIKIMAKASGQTMTEFTNYVIDAYQREHPEFLEQANSFLDFIATGDFSNKED